MQYHAGENLKQKTVCTVKNNGAAASYGEAGDQ